MVTPERQVGEFLLSGSIYGPAPGLKESRQVHPHRLGESLSIQVHLSVVVTGIVGNLVVGSKHLFKGIPAKLSLELHRSKQRSREM